MNRNELLNLLADLVQRKHITLDEAQRVLAEFDAGALTLPVTTPPQEDFSDWTEALVAILLLLGLGSVQMLNSSQRKRARTLLRSDFEANMVHLAIDAEEGMPVDVWQANMYNRVGTYARRMASAGAGLLPDADTRQTIDTNIRDQWPFLLAYSTLILARRTVERALSASYLAVRSTLYGGVGWDAFWRGMEDARLNRQGEIVYYVARDDNRTCGPCKEAQRNSPYIANGNHPYPGSVCAGGGLCRCELRFEYNPAIYRRLTGQRAIA